MIYLEENREKDDGERASDEHLARSDDSWLKHFHEREAHGSTQTAIRHYELLL